MHSFLCLTPFYRGKSYDEKIPLLDFIEEGDFGHPECLGLDLNVNAANIKDKGHVTRGADTLPTATDGPHHSALD